MAISSWVGLKEKYLNDDSSKEQLDKFDTMVKTVIDTLDFISVEKKSDWKVDFIISGKSETEKKANLLGFLNKLYAQTIKYEKVLDLDKAKLWKQWMKFDEQLFLLLEKTKGKNTKLSDLETELESVFDTMNLEINVLMSALSWEQKTLKKNVQSNSNYIPPAWTAIDDLASNEPEATEDIDYKFDSQERQKRIDILKKAVPELKQNTEKLFSEFEGNLQKAINQSKWSDKRKLERTLKKLRENKDGFKKEFLTDLSSLETALNSGDEKFIEIAYNRIQWHLNQLDNTLQLQEKALRDAWIWDNFNTNPPKYFVHDGFVVGMPMGMRAIIDEWRQMGSDFDYLVEKLQTGLNPNIEYKKVECKEYNYLWEDLDSFRKLRRYTKTSKEDGKDKLTDRYKGYKQFPTIKAISQQLDIKRTSIANLNRQDQDHGVLMVIKKFLSGDLWTIPEKYHDFKNEYKAGWKLADYEFGKWYKNDKLEAKRELHKFLLELQKKINQWWDTAFETKRILNALHDALTETDINASDIDNARILLMKDGLITGKNVFAFLCDFDSDGRITGADVDKKFLKNNRIDTGPIMGSTMLDMMRGHANTEKKDGRLDIVEWPKTTLMFASMFRAVYNDVEWPIKEYSTKDKKSFQKWLKHEISVINWYISGWKTNYSMNEFLRFLTAYPEFKGFLINAVKKDDIEVFASLQNQVEEKEEIAGMDGSVDQVYYEKMEEIRGKGSFLQLQEKLDTDTLTNVRAWFGKQFFRMAGNIVNIITSPSVDEAVRQSIIGALWLSSQVLLRWKHGDLSQLEYRKLLKQTMDKISANVAIDPNKITQLLAKDEEWNRTKPSTKDVLSTMGVWFGSSKTSADFSDKKTSWYGINFADLTLMGQWWSWKQTKWSKVDLQSLWNLDAKAVKRFGLEWWLSVSLLNLRKTRISWSIGTDLDYIAGISQQEQNEHKIMSYMLWLSGNKISGYRFDVKDENGQMVQDGGLSHLWKEKDLNRDKIQSSMNAYFANVFRFPKNINTDDLDEVSKMLVENQNMQDELKSEITKDLTDLIWQSIENGNWSKMTEVQKRLFIKQYMVAYMQWYLAVVKMRRQEDLSRGIKRWWTKLAVSVSAQDIINIASWSVWWPLWVVWSTLNYLRKNVILWLNFKSYRMHYTVDAANMANNYDKINRLAQKDLEVSNVSEAVKHLQEELKLLGDITVKEDPWKLKITGKDLHKLNISYLPWIKDQFSYTVNAQWEEELIVWNVGKIWTANYYKNDGVEVHLFLGNNKAVDTVRLSGYNTPTGTIDAIWFEPKSVEIGQEGIDDLKSEIDDNSFFTGKLALSDSEKNIVRNTIKAWLDQDPEHIKQAKAGKVEVSIKSGVSTISSASDVEFKRTETSDASLLPTATANKVSIEFQYSKTETVLWYRKSVDVKFENSLTSQIDGFRETVAGAEHKTNNRKLFKEYLAKASTDLNYDKAYKKLQEMAWADSQSSDIKTFLSNAKTDEEKRLIVNEFKGIFATNVLAHKKSSLDGVITNHRDTFTRLDWNEWGDLRSIADTLKQYRKDLVDEIKNSADGSWNIEHTKIEKNVFGYTAFYRTASGEDARKYSMTALWATRMLGGKSKEIDPTTKEWREIFGSSWLFFKNLEKNTNDLDDIVKQVNEALKKQDANISDLTKDQVLNLLKNPNKTIQLGDVKISPDIGYLFYLLGECANESFGLRLKFEVDKGGWPKTETITWHADTSRQQNRGLVVWWGVDVSDRNLWRLSEDRVAVQGGLPGYEIETRESSRQWDGITGSGNEQGVTTSGSGTWNTTSWNNSWVWWTGDGAWDWGDWLGGWG